MNTPTAPIGIYVRVSRKGDREDDRFHSPKEQAERATALAAARGFVVGPTFEDIDVSGATPPAERPAMSRMLQAIHGGTLGGIAAFSLDRLSREPAHGDALVREVTKAGGIILTPDIPDAIDTPTGEFTFGMLLQVAKLYRSQAGARFASAKERAIKAGIPVGPVPVGYRQRADRRLEPDPALAPIVRDLFERRARGESWSMLADRLSAALGRTVSRQAAAAVIANRIYATGRLQYGEIVSDVAAEALVEETLWHAAQRTQMRAPRQPDSKWLLTGLARCATCGHRLAPWQGMNRRRRDPRRGKMEWVPMTPTRRYRCANRACAARASVQADALERLTLLQSIALGAELERLERSDDLAELQAAVALADRRLSQVLAPEARDALGDLWAADVKARRSERAAALARLGAAREARGLAEKHNNARLEDIWDTLSTVDRRGVFALYWQEIRVQGSKLGETKVKFIPRGPGATAEIGVQ